MSTLVPKVRPADKVRNYLLQEFANSSDESIKRLPTMRQLADYLHVSLATIQTVYKGLVSEGYIVTRTGIGSFFNPKPIFAANKPLRIAMNVLLHEEGSEHTRYWFDGIYAGLMHAVLNKSLRIEFLSLSHRDKNVDKIFREKIEHGGCDGLLMLGHANQAGLEKVAQEYNIPVVYLYIPDFQVTTNFVSPAHFEFSRLAGQAFAASERKRVLFLSNGPFDAPADANIFSGLAVGLGDRLYQQTDLRYIDVQGYEDWNVNDLGKYIQEFSWVPDAVLCSGDYFVSEVIKLMESRGLRIPEDCSVIGASGINPSNILRPGFTHVLHPFQKIGDALIQFISRRIEGKGIALPGMYVDFQYSGGATTSEVENQVLKLTTHRAIPASSGNRVS